MTQQTPPYINALVNLGLVDLARASCVYPRCRDRDDLAVFRSESGVIFLQQSTRDYSRGSVESYYAQPSRAAALRHCAEDDSRRLNQFRELARNSTWVDVGSGLGGFVKLATSLCANVVGVEPQDKLRADAVAENLSIVASMADVPSAHFDVASLFHVLEHLSDPLRVLAEVRQCLKPGGKLIVEVPHARDFLLSVLDLEAFKAHTFWSEHLVLHTRESLRAFLAAAGFRVDAVLGYQRYPLANHFHWLAKGRGGGHKEWEFLRSANLDSAYEEKLVQMDASDTLIAVATAQSE